MTVYYNAKERQASELPGNLLGHVSPYIYYNHCYICGRKQFWHVQSLETSWQNRWVFIQCLPLSALSIDQIILFSVSGTVNLRPRPPRRTGSRRAPCAAPCGWPPSGLCTPPSSCCPVASVVGSPRWGLVEAVNKQFLSPMF